MSHTNKRWIVVFFCLLFFPVSVLAESGCFLYAESNLYCLDVEREQAEGECYLFEDCTIDNSFNSGKSCTDIADFPECQRVLCKSSCQQEFLGQCGAGAITPNEREQWCSPGCCRFTSRNQNHCSYTSNKWFCEVEVRNKLTSEFNFDSQLLEPECNQKCIIATAASKNVTEGLLVEKVSTEPPLASSSPSVDSTFLPSDYSKVTSEQLLSGPSSVVLGVIVLLIALLSLFYYWHQKETENTFF